MIWMRHYIIRINKFPWSSSRNKHGHLYSFSPWPLFHLLSSTTVKNIFPTWQLLVSLSVSCISNDSVLLCVPCTRYNRLNLLFEYFPHSFCTTICLPILCHICNFREAIILLQQCLVKHNDLPYSPKEHEMVCYKGRCSARPSRKVLIEILIMTFKQDFINFLQKLDKQKLILCW